MRKTEPELMYREDTKQWFVVLDQTIHKDKSITINNEFEVTDQVQSFVKQIFDDMKNIDWKNIESIVQFRKKWGDL